MVMALAVHRAVEMQPEGQALPPAQHPFAIRLLQNALPCNQQIACMLSCTVLTCALDPDRVQVLAWWSSAKKRVLC